MLISIDITLWYHNQGNSYECWYWHWRPVQFLIGSNSTRTEHGRHPGKYDLRGTRGLEETLCRTGWGGRGEVRPDHRSQEGGRQPEERWSCEGVWHHQSSIEAVNGAVRISWLFSLFRAMRDIARADTNEDGHIGFNEMYHSALSDCHCLQITRSGSSTTTSTL